MHYTIYIMDFDFVFDNDKITCSVNENCGDQHYRFLSYMSTLFSNSTIFDFSTDCESARYLSYNETNTVKSFGKENPDAIDDDLLETNNHDILESPLVFIDLHPHEGVIENKILQFLKAANYQGIILFDDIWYFKTMRDNIWYKIDEEYKLDVTEYSHWSGCGIVSFNKEYQKAFQMRKRDVSNWTLVTAYFNLTKCFDASDEIKARDPAFYMNSALSTLSLPYNLVIFCDEESREEIEKMRPTYLKDKTVYNIRNFDEFSFVKGGVKCEETFADYRLQIIENRINHPYNFDNRNTASYYLFCMSRYAMLKEVISLNLFGSTHFAWINFCIERMGFKNLIHLEEALATNRDKFSTCYIDYIPENLVRNLYEYFRWGRCSMCSGFFTGDAEHMYKVCDLIEDKFLYYLRIGYGHADEQLYSPVYFENPELFEHYYGDYQQMITNYKYIYDAPEPPVYNFIRNSFNNGDYKKCLEACEFILDSMKLGKCVLSDKNLMNELNICFENSKRIHNE